MTSKGELVRQHPHLSEVELANMLGCTIFYVRQQRALVRHINYRPGSFWTPERDEVLRRLWLGDAHSARQIAAVLGAPATRNSVIGRAQRLSLPSKAGAARGKAKGASLGIHPRETAIRINNARNGMRLDFSNKGKGKPFVLRDKVDPMKLSADPTPLPQPAPDDKARISFNKLENHHCRWPVGDTSDVGLDTPIFCGLSRVPGSGSSYCPGHTARAFAPVRPRHQSIPTDSNVIVLKKRETVAA